MQSASQGSKPQPFSPIMQSHNTFADLNYFFVLLSQSGSAGQGKALNLSILW